jgi:hypothetical protein
MTEVTVPSANQAVDSLTGFITKLTGFVSDIVASCHKEAAVVLAFLTATGTTPVPANHQMTTAGIFAGYAAIVHIAEKLFSKSASA